MLDDKSEIYDDGLNNYYGKNNLKNHWFDDAYICNDSSDQYDY